MPTYVYRCKECEHEFDIVQKMSDATLTVCPCCGELELFRVIGKGNFILKGMGWYKDDSNLIKESDILRK